LTTPKNLPQPLLGKEGSEKLHNLVRNGTSSAVIGLRKHIVVDPRRQQLSVPTLSRVWRLGRPITQVQAHRYTYLHRRSFVIEGGQIIMSVLSGNELPASMRMGNEWSERQSDRTVCVCRCSMARQFRVGLHQL